MNIVAIKQMIKHYESVINDSKKKAIHDYARIQLDHYKELLNEKN